MCDWTFGRFAGVLALLVFVVFGDVLFGSSTFRYRDFGFFSYPGAFHLRESLGRGEFPLWNPLSNCGVPFAAQWSYLTLYPPFLACLVLPLEWGLGALAVAHLYLAGLGMFRLARAWTGRSDAAALAGVLFAFNGFTLNCLMWAHAMAIIAWTPWLLHAVEKGWRNGGRKIGVATVIGMLHLAGGMPEFTLLTWGLASAIWFFHCAANGEQWIQTGKRFGLMMLLVAGVSAAQLLPFIEFLGLSQRGSSFGDDTWAMPPTGLVNLLVPQFRCYLNRDGTLGQYGQNFTASYYPGITAIVLALVAVALVRRRRVLPLALVTVTALILAMGDAGLLLPSLKTLLPILGFVRYPVKWVYLAAVTFPLLAAFGFAALRGDASSPSAQKPWRALLLATGVVLAGIGSIVLYAFWFPYGDHNWPMTWHNAAGRAGFLLAGAAGVAFLSRFSSAETFPEKDSVSPRPKHLDFLALSGLLVLCVADFESHLPNLHPVTDRSTYQPGRVPRGMIDPPRLGLNRAMISGEADHFFKYLFTADPAQDYALSRQALFSNCNLLDGLPKVDGFNPLYLRHQHQLLQWLQQPTNQPSAGLLDFLGVSQVTRPGTVANWNQRTTALPLATLVGTALFLGEEAGLNWVLGPRFDPRVHVVLPPEARDGLEQRQPERAHVVAAKVSAHRVKLELTAPDPAWVVLNQTYHPRWKAWADGVPVRVWRGNHAFQAVRIAANTRRIEFAYVDTPFHVGLGISLLSWAAVIGLLLRRPAGASPSCC